VRLLERKIQIQPWLWTQKRKKCTVSQDKSSCVCLLLLHKSLGLNFDIIQPQHKPPPEEDLQPHPERYGRLWSAKAVTVSKVKHFSNIQIYEFTKRKDTKSLYHSPLMFGWTAACPPTPHQSMSGPIYRIPKHGQRLSSPKSQNNQLQTFARGLPEDHRAQRPPVGL
jgi:hypothetical protein